VYCIHGRRFDKENGDKFWKKMMNNMRVAFKVLGNYENTPGDHLQKGLLLGACTDSLATTTYASIVPQGSVRIPLLIDTPNNLDATLPHITTLMTQGQVSPICT
jgi:hypothetical protein